MSAPFSYTVSARDVPASGRIYKVEADADECRAIAADLNIPEVRSLTAQIEIRPVRGRSFRLRGRLKAEVVQTCVVSLGPAIQHMDETIDLTLLPAEVAGAEYQAKDVLVDAMETDTSELFQNGRIDLGTILAEHLALGLDPYPRAEGVDFSGHIEDQEDAEESAFGALARLKSTES
ncbi:Uncharacterized ACR, COG1399 [Faunimonas pinastri]|uniref:Uncharacterized ACR, COG1399 n=1 Tax=Faunimonas pinastri TaxID=1855383 RepID=A0A1H9CCD2_9HYPH|nr:DUF177 domain-containing protein [Faunimonas pinastri]SEP98809.1 Uncharacterized ACR, COG1399 [Faunimonas pinastri]